MVINTEAQIREEERCLNAKVRAFSFTRVTFYRYVYTCKYWGWVTHWYTSVHVCHVFREKNITVIGP